MKVVFAALSLTVCAPTLHGEWSARSFLRGEDEARQAPSTAYEPQPGEERSWLSDPSLEFAVSSDSFWLGFRSGFARGRGHQSIGVLGNDEDDFLVQVSFLRYGAPVSDTPLELGVGIAGYAAFLDVEDESVFALALSGRAGATFPAAYPVTTFVEVSYAPDVTTFDAGDEWLDVLARVELGISRDAAAFLGYRYVHTELNRRDRELDDSLHAGIRIRF